MRCPYCGSDTNTVDECKNENCGGYIKLVPTWQWNNDWGKEPLKRS